MIYLKIFKEFEVKQAYAPGFEVRNIKIFWKILCSNPKLKEYFLDNGYLVLPVRKYLLYLNSKIPTLDFQIEILNIKNGRIKIGIICCFLQKWSI